MSPSGGPCGEEALLDLGRAERWYYSHRMRIVSLVPHAALTVELSGAIRADALH
jgi:hypothetical protein